MSYNIQYVEHKDRVKAKYVKTKPHMVAGVRIDPNDNKSRIEFLIRTPEKDFDFDKKQQKYFSYEDEVVELYSDAEVKIFSRANKVLIEAGILIPFEGKEQEVRLENSQTDEQLKQLLKEPLDLSSITSKVTLERLLSLAEEMNIPVKVVRQIETKIKSL